MNNDHHIPPHGLAASRAMPIASALFLLLFLVVTGIVWRANGPLPLDLTLSAGAASLREPLLNQLMIDASYLCVWQVLVAGGIAASLWLLAWKRWIQTVVIWLSLLGNSLIVWGIKSVVARPRPDQAQALLPATGDSFPSGHAFSSLAFYGLLGLMLLLTLRSRIARSAVAAGIAVIMGLVGLSRVYVGAHWPTDVLGSWLLGLAWLSLLIMLLAGGQPTQPKDKTSRSTRMIVSGLVALCLWGLAISALAAFDPAVRMSGSVG